MKFAKLFVVPSVLALSLCAISCSSTKNSRAQQADNDSSSQAQRVRTDTPKASPFNQLAPYETIYFDFNKYVIRQDQLSAAREIATDLKAHPEKRIQIQGNTDDRGSVEYNMALGNKRANSLKKFLVIQGAQAEHISTVSFGKEHPALEGSGEEVWAKNRRDDVVIKK